MLLRNPADFSVSETAAWEMIAATAPLPDPHSCGPVWQITALACSRRAGAPIVLKQASDSQVAFALTAAPGGHRLGPLEAHWNFGSPVLGADGVELFREVIEELKKNLQPGNLEVSIPGLDPHGGHAQQINKAFPDVTTLRQDRQAAASLIGGVDGWLSRRSSNFRRNLKRTERRAEAAAISMERHVPRTQTDAEACYERMLKIEQQSWKGRLGEGLLQLQAFYRTLLTSYADQKAARVVFARRDGEDVGFCFGGANRGLYRGQQTSYSETVSGIGIGALMHFETTKWLVDEGASLQHFGPVQRMMSYKSSYCEIERPSVRKVFSI